MSDPNDLIFAATAFAARAHQGHLRKDKETPYVCHPFRVCFVVRHVFGFDGPPAMFATALLHDTIEDTRTDYDDLLEEFGPTVADWVALLSKDRRLEDKDGKDGRETRFVEQLKGAPWQVKAVKLADIYDNAWDFENYPADQKTTKKRGETAKKYWRYLDAVSSADCPPGQPEVGERFKTAVGLVADRLKKLESGLPS